MIDSAVIKQLVNSYDTGKLQALISQSKTADVARIEKLTEYALVGNLKGIAVEADALKVSAEFLGMRRVANRATELLRLANLKNKGQAFLQCQAITKLIATEISQDFKAISDAITV